MQTTNKVLLMLLCAVVPVAGSVFGTMAYLTDNDAATNTFTVGQVHMKLDEAKVNPDGTYVTDNSNRVTENEYHLIPGHTYIKDPTIHISDDSEDCYLFVRVENSIRNIETNEEGKTIAEQMEDLGWVAVDGATDIYVLAKGEGEADYTYTVSKGAEVEVFKNFIIDGDKVVNVPDGETVPDGKVDLTPYAAATVKVTAYAVQAAGFDTSLDAWKATFGVNSTPGTGETPDTPAE